MAVDTAGTIDNAADNEEDCLRQVRCFLRFCRRTSGNFRRRSGASDPVDRCEDGLLPYRFEAPAPPYIMKKLVDLVVDRDSVFEIQPTFGRR